MNDMRSSSVPEPTAQPEAWPRELTYWRTFDAYSLDADLTSAIEACVSSIGSTMPEWQAALRGDHRAAIQVATMGAPPLRLSIRVDAVMTLLLRSALRDARAAVVLSNLIRRMPLDPSFRARLSTSWLAHGLRLSRYSYARGSLPSAGDAT